MNLNKNQWMAFRILTQSFLETHLQLSSDPEAIHIFITGPNGMCNSHIVNALQALMVEYGSENSLWFLTSTGSATSLIDGMTVHKRLGIKIKSNNKGKGNHE